MARGSIFHGLAEGPIRFLPTYKFEKNRESSAVQPFYDQGEKMRVPAWTDRVFFRASAPQQAALQPNAAETAADVRVRAGWWTADAWVVLPASSWAAVCVCVCGGASGLQCVWPPRTPQALSSITSSSGVCHVWSPTWPKELVDAPQLTDACDAVC